MAAATAYAGDGDDNDNYHGRRGCGGTFSSPKLTRSRQMMRRQMNLLSLSTVRLSQSGWSVGCFKQFVPVSTHTLAGNSVRSSKQSTDKCLGRIQKIVLGSHRLADLAARLSSRECDRKSNRWANDRSVLLLSSWSAVGGRTHSSQQDVVMALGANRLSTTERAISMVVILNRRTHDSWVIVSTTATTRRRASGRVQLGRHRAASYNEAQCFSDLLKFARKFLARFVVQRVATSSALSSVEHHEQFARKLSGRCAGRPRASG